MFEFLVKSENISIGKMKRCKNCKKNVDISVGDVRQGRVLCSMCGYSNAIVFFLKHSTKVR